MANSFNLTAQINLQGPKNVKSVVSNIKKQLKGISVDVQLKVDKNASKDIKNLTKNLGNLNTAAQRAKTNLQQLGAAAQKVSASNSKLAASTSKLNKQIASSGKGFQNTQKQVKQAATAMEDFGKQSALAVKRFAAFTIVTSIVNQFTTAISNATSEFIKFDREMVRVAQVTGAAASEIGSLSNEISKVSRSFGVSSNELAEVSVTLSQAGLSATETRLALQALAKADLAPTFDNMKNTTEGAIAAMRQFNLSVNDLEGALGSINAVAAKFAVGSQDIITAVQRVGGVFAASSRGISEGQDALNEFIALFTSVRATTRESSETIATGLRTIFTRIQRGSTINFLRQFNVELQDLEGNFVGPFEAVRRLSEGLANIDPRSGQFNKIIEELGGFRQVGKVIPLLQEFATAQDALAVAQAGSGSLAADAAKGQLALAIQIAKVREEFLSFIRDIGQSGTFQALAKGALTFASALISIAGAFKPILPLLAAMTAIKGIGAIREFGGGFMGALREGGGAGGVGSGIGGALTGTGGAQQTASLDANTAALKVLTTSVNNLNATIRAGGGGGGRRAFASGGFVPGSGNRDTVPAMLTPGEFVIRKSAVEAFGVGNLSKINKYNNAGKTKRQKTGATKTVGNVGAGQIVQKPVTVARGILTDADLDKSELAPTAIGAVKGYMFENDFARAYQTGLNPSDFPDIMSKTVAKRVMGRNSKAEALELKYADTSGNRSSYRKALAASGKTSEQIPMITRMATGGSAVGTDTVPSLLTPGEFVINKRSAQAFGYGNLRKINKYAKGGTVQRFANGDTVQPSQGSLFGGFSFAGLKREVGQVTSSFRIFNKDVKTGTSTVGRFVGKVDDALAPVGGFTQALGVGATIVGSQAEKLGGVFQDLTGEASETSAAFQGAVQGLQGLGSGIQSGAFAGAQIGGRRGAMIAGAAGGAVQGLAGVFKGFADAAKAASEKMLLAAQQDQKEALEDLEAARNTRESIQAFAEYTQTVKATIQANKDAAAEADTLTARTGRLFDSLASGLSILFSLLGTLAFARGMGPRRMSTGGTVYASGGKLINFQPRGTDTVPAMLTPGEFVVNARSTKKHRGILEAINRQQGGMIPQYLRQGGRSGGRSTTRPTNSQYKGDVESTSFFNELFSEHRTFMDMLSAFYVSGSEEYKELTEKGDGIAKGLRVGGQASLAVAAGATAGAIGAGLVAIIPTLTTAFTSLSGVVATALTSIRTFGKAALIQAQRLGLRATGQLKNAPINTATAVRPPVSRPMTHNRTQAPTASSRPTTSGSTQGHRGPRRNTPMGSPGSIPGQSSTGPVQQTAGMFNNLIYAGTLLYGGFQTVSNLFFKSEEAIAAESRARAQNAKELLNYTKTFSQELPGMLSNVTLAEEEGLTVGAFDDPDVFNKAIEELNMQRGEEQKALLSDLSSSTSLLATAAQNLGMSTEELEDSLRTEFLSQRGITGTEAQAQIDDGFDADLEKQFKSFVANREREARQNLLTAQTIKTLNQEMASMTATAARMTQVFKILNNDLKEIVAVNQSYVDVLNGQFDATKSLRDTNSEVLNNPAAFSADRFASVTGGLAQAGGNTLQLQQAAAMVQLKKAIDDIDRVAGPDADPEFLAQELEKRFENIGTGLGEDFDKIKDNLAQSAATAIATGDDEALEEFNKTAAEADKILQGIAQIKFESLKQLSTIANQTAQALGKLNDITRRQNEARFESDFAIQEARGERVTAADRARQARSDAEMRALQAGLGEGETLKERRDSVSRMDDAQMARALRNRLTEDLPNEIDAATAKRDSLMRQRDAMPMGADTKAIDNEIIKTNERIGELGNQSAEAKAALEGMVNSTAKFDAAVEALAERTKMLKAQQESLIDAVLDPEGTKERAFNRQEALAGRGGAEPLAHFLRDLDAQLEAGLISQKTYDEERERALTANERAGGRGAKLARAVRERDVEKDARAKELEEEAKAEKEKRLAMFDELKAVQEKELELRRKAAQEILDLTRSKLHAAMTESAELFDKFNEKMKTFVDEREAGNNGNGNGNGGAGSDQTKAPPAGSSPPTSGANQGGRRGGNKGGGGEGGGQQRGGGTAGQTVKLEGDLTNRVVVDGTQFVGQIDELATVIQNNTFDAVAFSIDEATNGNIKIVRA
tara:strand:+ start:413 stop:6838 length:6426 start_codon:yes stop_codon:yes gene_type:complete